MDRVIKFRGGDFKGKWHFGSYIEGDEENTAFIYEPHTPIPVPVDPNTVGQFTGFLDCEKHEIYEDDFIQNQEHPEIVYHIMLINGCWCGVLQGDVIRPLYLILEKATFKVIGNVFDNPELLKGIK